MTILTVAFWAVIFFLIVSIFESMVRCPKEGCGGRMEDVEGWDKEKCDRCDFVQ